MLTSPDGEIRYCGGTTRPLKQRLYEHIRNAQISLNPTHCSNWIKSLLDNGLKPEIKEIEQLEYDNYHEAEKKWISHFRANNIKLTNLTNGGNGMLGYIPKPESIKKWKETNAIVQEIKQYYKNNRY